MICGVKGGEELFEVADDDEDEEASDDADEGVDVGDLLSFEETVAVEDDECFVLSTPAPETGEKRLFSCKY
jgi:hypothetical protein